VHPIYRFIPLHFAGYVSLHSSRILSAPSYCFSGGDFRPPSGFAQLTSLSSTKKYPFLQFTIHYQVGRYALNQGSPSLDLYFFPAVLRSQYCSPLPPDQVEMLWGNIKKLVIKCMWGMLEKNSPKVN
jgi:hypothetical protein